jgi:hypothetical protein
VTGRRPGWLDWVILAVLVIDSVVLALVEVFFLPLRLDGTLLPDLGQVPFPITVVLALVTMPLLITRAASVSGRLLVAGAPLWVWLATIAVVGTVGVENAVLLQDWRTLLLLACGALPAAVALGNSMGRRSAARRSVSEPGSSTGSGDAARSRASRTG